MRLQVDSLLSQTDTQGSPGVENIRFRKPVRAGRPAAGPLHGPRGRAVGQAAHPGQDPRADGAPRRGRRRRVLDGRLGPHRAPPPGSNESPPFRKRRQLPSGSVNVEVIRSPRRRKTVQARRVNGVVRVTIPATMTRAEEERWVAEMVRRLERSTGADGVDLEERAAQLADRYELPRPTSIRWVDNQELRWGSCTPVDGSIRISSKLLTRAGLGARLRHRPRAGPPGRAGPRPEVLGPRRPLPAGRAGPGLAHGPGGGAPCRNSQPGTS